MSYNLFVSIFIFTPRASAEVGGGVFTDSKTTFKTLAILLFLGVAVVVTDSFGNAVTSIFGCTASFFDSSSLVGSAIAFIGIAGAVSVARGTVSAFSINFGTLAVSMHFSLRVKTLTFFAFGAPEEVEAATFLFSPLPLDGKVVIWVNKPNNIEHPI
jgi:nicotinamide riboside transporter PnuC